MSGRGGQATGGRIAPGDRATPVAATGGRIAPRRGATSAAQGGGVALAPEALLVGADVGNSKTDVVLIRTDGTILAAVRGPTASHQQVGMSAGAGRLRGLVDDARRAAGLDAIRSGRPAADVAVVCAAGADFRDEIARLAAECGAAGVAAAVRVTNDTDAVLRAGSPAGWGVAVVCGAGINCLGVAPDGRTARFPALGYISGDRGGGGWLGAEALAAAVRARDGRGPRTSLETVVPARFGLRRPLDVTYAVYRGRIDEERLGELAPDVFAAAVAGDAVARTIVDGLADEIVGMVASVVRRLRIVGRRPPVVLAGGIFDADDPAFFRRIDAGIERVAPGSAVVRLGVPPVLGAVLLCLDAARLDDPAPAEARLRAALAKERPS